MSISKPEVNVDFKSELKHFSGDFEILTDTLKFVEKYIHENRELKGTKPIWSEWKNGCSVRLVFPHTAAKLVEFLSKNSPSCESGSEPWFVGFFGEQQEKHLIDQNLRDDVWKTDEELLDALKLNGQILLYLSSEVSKGGDWYNFVFFSGEQGILDWKNTPCHERAVRYGFCGQNLT